MTLNFSGFTNPRTGQRLPSTVLQVWGRDQNISSTYHHNIGRINWNSQDCGMVLDSRVKGKECWPIRKHVLCLKCNRRRQDESEPEESDDEWAAVIWVRTGAEVMQLGSKKNGCLMSRSQSNLTTNLKSLLLQEDNRHWLAKYPKIPTLTCVEYLPHTEGLTAWSPTNLSFQMMRHKSCFSHKSKIFKQSLI